MIQGFQVTQCIYVAAKLGIADLLKDDPRTSAELAQAIGTHAPSLYRVLRLLTAAGFELTQIMPAQTLYNILEAVRA